MICAEEGICSRCENGFELSEGECWQDSKGFWKIIAFFREMDLSYLILILFFLRSFYSYLCTYS